MVLTRLQNRALRFVYGLKKFDHISEHRLSAGVLSVVGCCNLQTVKLVHKVLETGKPEYLRRKLVYRWEVSSQSTRQDSFLNLPRTRLQIGKKSFRHFGPYQYNSLPPELKDLSIRQFKIMVKNVFI